MIETFWFLRLDEGEMRKNEVGNDGIVAGRWKKVMETGIRFANNMKKDRESYLSYNCHRCVLSFKMVLLCIGLLFTYFIYLK